MKAVMKVRANNAVHAPHLNTHGTPETCCGLTGGHWTSTKQVVSCQTCIRLMTAQVSKSIPYYRELLHATLAAKFADDVDAASNKTHIVSNGSHVVAHDKDLELFHIEYSYKVTGTVVVFADNIESVRALVEQQKKRIRMPLPFKGQDGSQTIRDIVVEVDDPKSPMDLVVSEDYLAHAAD